MLFDRRRRRVVVEVIVVASLMLATLGGGYLVLAASGEEDRLVTKGVQKITICGGSRKSQEIWYKLTEEVPGASGTWGTDRGKKDGDCKVWLHYADTGPAD
jgi:hypothetical protein